MGSGLCTALGPEPNTAARAGAHSTTGLGDLPESCVADVIVHLDPPPPPPPPDICLLACLNRAFGAAATADCVWESKLPRNYNYLVEMGTLKGLATKKEVYAKLCRPNRFDAGNKEFWMEKRRGGKCVAVSAKALAITGIDDRRYWNYIPTEESRFHSVAYLQQVWWLEVAGEIDFCFPPGTYSLYFHLHLGRSSRWLGRRISNLEYVHEWDVKPVTFQLWTSNGQHARSECHLNEPGCWNRYHVGDFVVGNTDVPTKVKFLMTQIDCTHTKGGLCIDTVLIYPNGLAKDGPFVGRNTVVNHQQNHT